MSRSVFFPLTLLLITPVFAPAADDDLFSSKPTTPRQTARTTTAPMPTSGAAPGSNVPEVLPLAPAGPLTPDQVAAERARQQQIAQRLTAAIQGMASSGTRDDILQHYAEVLSEIGDYQAAAQAASMYEYKGTAVLRVVHPLARRFATMGNQQGVRQLIQYANGLAGQQFGDYSQAFSANLNTEIAALAGDDATLREQVEVVRRAFVGAANRDAINVSFLLDLADAAIGFAAASYDEKSFFAEAQSFVAKVYGDAGKGQTSKLARAQFHAGLVHDAVATVTSLDNPLLLELYTDAAALAAPDAISSFDEVWLTTSTRLASASDFRRFSVYGLAARSLSGQRRHEAALQVAFAAELARRAYYPTQDSTRDRPEAENAIAFGTLGNAFPGAGKDIVEEVVRYAIWKEQADVVLARVKVLPADAPERVVPVPAEPGKWARSVAATAVDTVVTTLLDREDLDRAIQMFASAATPDCLSAQALTDALVRAGRLADAERLVFGRPLTKEQATPLWNQRLALADAWRVEGDPTKARTLLASAEADAVAYHTSLGQAVLPLQPGELPRIMTRKDPATGRYDGSWRYPSEPAAVAMAWVRLGDADAARKLLGSFTDHTFTKARWWLAEWQHLADTGNFAALAQKLAAAGTLDLQNTEWSTHGRPFCVTLARAGQWKLLETLAAKLPAAERLAPDLVALSVVSHRLKEAASTPAQPAVAADAKVILAPYAQWVATVPEANREVEESRMYYAFGRLGAWEEAFTLAGAAELSAARKTSAWLILSNAARDNRDWTRAAECFAKARESLAQVTGTDRTVALLIDYCNEALFTRDLSDLGDRFREAAQLISQAATPEERTNQFSELAVVAARGGDNAAFQQLAGATIQNATAWAKEEPGENGGGPRSDYSISWFVRQLTRMGHVEVAEKITQGNVTSELEKNSLQQGFTVGRLLATPDEKLVDALKSAGDQGARLRALVDTYGDNLALVLAEQGRSEIVFKLMLMARDGDFATGYDSQGFGAAAGANASVKSLLEYNWPHTVERMARAYVRAGQTTAAIKLGDLYTTPRKPFASGAGIPDDEYDSWLSAYDELLRPNIDYTSDQARFAGVLAELGLADEARRLLQAIPASAFNESADYLRENVVVALAHLGEIARAETMASVIKEPGSQMNAHTALALAAVRKADATLAKKHLAIARTAAADQRTKSHWRRPRYLAALVLGGEAEVALEEIGAQERYLQGTAAREPALEMTRLGRWQDIAPWIARVPETVRSTVWSTLFDEIAPRPRDPSVKP